MHTITSDLRLEERSGVRSASQEAPDFHVQLALTSAWPNVELMRGVVNRFVYSIFDDDDFGETVAMVSAELMENAIKYGYYDPVQPGRIGFQLTSDRQLVKVKVTNPVAPDEEPSRTLFDAIEWLDRQEDAQTAYRERMRQVFEGDVVVGGLGLVRIAYEGGCRLSCERESDTEIAVTATFVRVARASARGEETK